MLFKSRVARLGAVAVGILGLLGTTAPPAHATTISVTTFVGNAILAAPLSYPINPTAPDQQLTILLGTTVHPTDIVGHCLGDLLTLLIDLPTTHVVDPVPQCHINPGGHKRAVAVVGLAGGCVNAVVNINKPNKLPFHAGACALGPALPLGEGNHVHGYCGLSSGQVTTQFTDALGQNFELDIHWTVGFGGTLILTGHWYKPNRANKTQQGLLVGVVTAVPIPVPTGTTLGNSCSGSTATNFTIVATVAAVSTL